MKTIPSLEDIIPNTHYEVFLCYILKLKTHSEVRKDSNMTAQQFRFIIDKAVSNYKVFCIKQAIYFLVQNPKCNPEKVFKEFGLVKRDIYAFTLMTEKYKTKLKKNVRGFKVEHPKEVLKQCQEFMTTSKYSSFISKFVYRKLNFIVKYNNIEYEDLIGELKIAGLKGVYKACPFYKSKEHIFNILRMSIHNHGINLITRFTTKKRARIINDGESDYAATVVTLPDSYINDEEIKDARDEFNPYKQVETKISLDKILLKWKGSKGGKAIQLLSCFKDQKFLDFCNSQSRETLDTLDDALEHFGDKYKMLVMKYLKLNPRSYFKFLEGVRKEVA